MTDQAKRNQFPLPQVAVGLVIAGAIMGAEI